MYNKQFRKPTSQHNMQCLKIRKVAEYKSSLRLLVKLSDIPPVSPLFGGYQGKLFYGGWAKGDDAEFQCSEQSFLVLAHTHIFHLLCSAEHHPLKKKTKQTLAVFHFSSFYPVLKPHGTVFQTFTVLAVPKIIGHCTLQVFTSSI